MHPVGIVVVAAATAAVVVAVEVVAAAAEVVEKDIVEVEIVVGHIAGTVQLQLGHLVLDSSTGLAVWTGQGVVALGIAVGSKSFGMDYEYCSCHVGH